MEKNNQQYDQKLSFLGISVNPMTQDELLELLFETITSNKKLVIGHHNLHSIYLFHHDRKMMEFYDLANKVFIDGVPLILINNFFNRTKLSLIQRITSLDWILPLLELATKNNWRLFYLGSKPEVLDRGVKLWKDKFPGLNILTHHGYFDHSANSEENASIIRAINEFHPDILFVGMGMPLQENWIYENYPKLNPKVIFTIGACIDYFAKEISTPPRFISKFGFEWLFRLANEPQRLWRRYLIEPWYILYLILKNLLHLLFR